MKKHWWIILLIIATILWFPTGEPTDIIAFGIIANLGINKYLFFSAIILIILWNIIEGKGIRGKFNTVKHEIKSIWK